MVDLALCSLTADQCCSVVDTIDILYYGRDCYCVCDVCRYCLQCDFDYCYRNKLMTTTIIKHSLLYNRLFNIVGGQHASFTGTLHASSHPSRINGLHLKYNITFTKTDLVNILRFIIIQSTINPHA